MRGSIRFLRVGGIDIKVHFTFLIFLVWFGFTYYFFGGVPAAVQGLLFIVLLFACVLLHELGHALMARRFGVRTPDITLLPIGGIARLERIPEKPVQELLIAIAGPMVNVVIAAVLILLLRQGGKVTDLAEIGTPGLALMSKLAIVNVFLVLFNLIPAFPMDGGRILRSLLAMRIDYVKATHIAARTGQVLAILFGVLGLFFNPLLIFIALFVYLGATQEAAMAQVKGISKGLPVSAAMVTEFKALPGGMTLEAAAEAVLRTPQQDFPVVHEDNRPLGMVTREEIVTLLRRSGGAVLLGQTLEGPIATVHPADDLGEALVRLQQSGNSALAVVDEAGQLVGMVTSQGLSELMVLHRRGGQDKKSFWRPAHA